jgi:hypothetical protein
LLRGKVEVHTFVFCVGFLQQATEKLLLLLPCVFVSGRQADSSLACLVNLHTLVLLFLSLCAPVSPLGKGSGSGIDYLPTPNLLLFVQGL